MNRDEFEKLYIENYPKVYAFIYNITNNSRLTEDILQDAFIKAYAKIDTFRNESRVDVWINKIAYHIFIDNKRKKSSHEILSEDDIIFNDLKAFQTNLHKGLEQKLMSECVQSKLLLLSEKYRGPLYLDTNGYSNQEIADILNISLENVKIRLYRGRKQMKDILGNQCSFYQDERNVLC